MGQFYYARRGVFLTEANDGEFGRQNAIEDYEWRNFPKKNNTYEQTRAMFQRWRRQLKEMEEKD